MEVGVVVGVVVLVGEIVVGAGVGARVDGKCVGDIVGWAVGLVEGSRLFVGLVEGFGGTGVGLVVDFCDKEKRYHVDNSLVNKSKRQNRERSSITAKYALTITGTTVAEETAVIGIVRLLVG